MISTIFGPEFNEAYPLHSAVLMRRADLLQETIESKMDVDWRGPGNITPLMVAAREGFQDYVDLLIKAGANVNTTQIFVKI